MCSCVGIYERTSLVQQCLACLAHLRWFVRWEVSSRTHAVLQDAASRICSMRQSVFLCSSHLVFFSSWFNYTVVLTRLQLGRIPVWFYLRDVVVNQLISVEPCCSKRRKLDDLSDRSCPTRSVYSNTVTETPLTWNKEPTLSRMCFHLLLEELKINGCSAHLLWPFELNNCVEVLSTCLINKGIIRVTGNECCWH